MPYPMFTVLPSRAIPSFSNVPAQDVQCEGWLLKKQRRKRQGFAGRYFVLRAAGVLSYARRPQLTPRGQLDLHTATISSSTSRREIHIDCESGTYHVKATSAGDFEMWMAAFRKFIHVTSERGTLSRKFSLLRSLTLPSGSQVNKITITLEEMGSTIKALDNAVRSAKSHAHGIRHGIQNKVKKDNTKDREGFRGIFRKSAVSQSSTDTTGEPADIIDTSYTPSFDDLLGIVQTLKSQLDNLRKGLVQAESNMTTFLNSPLVESPETSPKVYDDHDHQQTKTSFSTVASGDAGAGSVWYDAVEGPEEFVIKDENIPISEAPEGDLGSGSDSVETMSTADFEDEDLGDEYSNSENTQLGQDDLIVTRRTILPAPVSGDEISLFALLRKNIGKDLSTVTFPVTANEPLGLLQRVAEDMEYTHLLSQACATMDPTDRMCLVAAFAVSGFACTRLRSSRKPFTPMLGETFEDPRTKFIAEKVSNHPLVIACHGEGNGWELWGTSFGKNHFWGKSLEIEQMGATHLRIGNDHFQWYKPSSFVRNLLVGAKYLEHVGSLSIENKTTGARCVIDFKEAGYWGAPNVVSGTVFSTTGKVETRLEGTWHEQLSQVLSPSHLRVLWRANAFPQHAPQYYGLTFFATTLNEITKDIEGKLPPTDTRYRPDLRALEEGNVALAESEKTRIEGTQRERRRNGTEVEPKWFRKVGPDDYVYNGDYWEQRAKGWSGYPHLW